MAATVLVQAQVEEALKSRAEEIFAERGQTLSEAVNAFLVQTVEGEEDAYKPLRPNAETLAAIDEARRGENMTSVASIQELMARVHAED